jgi:hypothetical protein
MPAAVKRRAPGAGRKPQGKFKGNYAVLNLRVTPEVRTALERAIEKNGSSLSQEAQRRLDSSFEEDRRARKQRPDLRALTAAITMLTEHIERKTGHRWQDGAFTTQALQAGVEFLIRHFGAGGEVVVPSSVAETADRQRNEGLNPSVTPSAIGWEEAGYVIGMIERWHHIKVKEIPRGNAPPEWDIHSRLMRDLRAKPEPA